MEAFFVDKRHPNYSDIFTHAYLGSVPSRSDYFGDVIARLMFPQVEPVLTASYYVRCQNEMILLSIDLELHKLKYGIYPDSLDKLIPEFRQEIEGDKFSNHDYIYRKNDSSFLLYSVGPNQKDDRDGKYPDDWPLLIDSENTGLEDYSSQ